MASSKAISKLIIYNNFHVGVYGRLDEENSTTIALLATSNFFLSIRQAVIAAKRDRGLSVVTIADKKVLKRIRESLGHAFYRQAFRNKGPQPSPDVFRRTRKRGRQHFFRCSAMTRAMLAAGQEILAVTPCSLSLHFLAN